MLYKKMTRSDKEWITCDIWSPEVSSTCTSTPPAKQAASEEKQSVKRTHESSSNLETQSVSSVFTILRTVFQQVSGKRPLNVSTHTKIVRQRSVSWILDFVWTDSFELCRIAQRNTSIVHVFYFRCISEASPFKFTRLLQNDALCAHPLLNCVCLSLTTDFISRLWFKSRWILLTRSRLDQTRHRLAGGR